MDLQEFKQNLTEVANSNIEDIQAGLNVDKIIHESLKMESFDEFEKKHGKFFWGKKADWGIATADLSQMDLSKYPLKALLRIKFSTETIWPTADKLPEGFNPKKLIENAKKFKGFGIEKVHQLDIKGSSATIAYIDKPFDVEHAEFKDRNIEYIDLTKGEKFDFHGYAVMSRLCGKNIGVAPDAKVIYYACSGYLEKTPEQDITALRDIIKRVKNNERIDAIGQSGEIEYQISFIKDEAKRETLKDELKRIKAELNELNIPLIDAECFWNTGFSYSFYLDPTSTYEDNLISISGLKRNNNINVIDAGKCIPMPYTQDGYVYENGIGCASWSIPQVVGLYALAKQIDQDITFDEFAEICKTTASTNKNGIKLVNADEMIKEVEFRKENNFGV